MSNPEKAFLYKQVSSVQVPGFVIDKVGEDLVSPAQSPFKEGFIPDFSQAVTGYKRLKSSPQLVQVSPAHKRAFEMRYNPEGLIIWADEHGNLYGVLQNKGANVSDPDVKVEPRAPSGFTIWGIQDSDSILRTVRGSNMMRAAGIATEAIVRLTEPTHLQFKGQPVTLEEYKKRLVQRVWEDNHRRFKKRRSRQPATRADIPKLSQELQKMTFYITTLGRQVSERFVDLKYISSQGDLKRVMKRAFTFWNRHPRSSRTFDANNLEDIYEYFKTDLPAETARNYGKLHGGLDLLHVYPHLGNISLVGSIYDDDSIYGEPLGVGDEKVTEKQKLDEIKFLLQGIRDIEHGEGILNLIQSLVAAKHFPKEANIEEGFLDTFVLEYIKNRRWDQDFEGNVNNLVAFLNATDIVLLGEAHTDLRDRLFSVLGQDKTIYLGKVQLLNTYYDYSVVVDVDNIPLPEAESAEPLSPNLTEERKEELLGQIKQLFVLHQDHLVGYPWAGKDYFSFPKVSADILTAHQQLTKQDITDLVYWWTSRDLQQQLSQEYNQRTFGAFLLTISQVHAVDVQEALSNFKIDTKDPEIALKLARLNEFWELTSPTVHKAGNDFVHVVYNLIEDRDEAHYISHEAEVRSGIAMFGYGFITRHLHEIFNHRQVTVMLNRFSIDQAQALSEAIQCPRVIDPLMGDEPTARHLKLALTSVQVKNGQTADLAILTEGEASDTKESTFTYLQYLFASQDKDTITDEHLKQLLEFKISTDWLTDSVWQLIKTKKPLHPNSYLAQAIKEADFRAEELAGIVKIALDTYEGDLQKLDPTLKQLLESKRYSGTITAKTAAPLVWACMGFGIDLPELIKPCLDSTVNDVRFTSDVSFMSFLSVNTVYRSDDDLRRGMHYPTHPVYAMMSKGVAALPEELRRIFAEHSNDQSVIDSFATDILKQLFIDGYYRYYFGALVNIPCYPDPQINFESLLFPKGQSKFGYQISGIVHQDIWNILRLADPKVLRRFFKPAKLEDAKIRVEAAETEASRKGWLRLLDSPLAECFPKDLFEKISFQ